MSVTGELVVDGRVAGRVEVAAGHRARTRGLLGRDGIDGAMLLAHGSSVHTIGMRFPIDVAFLARDSTVLDVVTMARGRIGRPRLKSRSILEAAAGSFAGWGLRPGSRIEIRDQPG